MAEDYKEARIGVKAQEVFNYASLSRTTLTEAAFTKAKLSFEKMMQNVCDRDRYKAPVFRRVLGSIAAREESVAWCDMPAAEKIAKVIVYQWMPDDLNLYPETAEKKIGYDAVKGRVTPWRVDEMTVRDMLYFVKAHTVDRANISPQTMPGVYKYLMQYFSFENVYMCKVLAQVYFGVSVSPRGVKGWDEGGGAGRKLVSGGVLCEGADGRVSVSEDFLSRI